MRRNLININNISTNYQSFENTLDKHQFKNQLVQEVNQPKIISQINRSVNQPYYYDSVLENSASTDENNHSYAEPAYDMLNQRMQISRINANNLNISPNANDEIYGKFKKNYKLF